MIDFDLADDNYPITVDYVNYRGERSIRKLKPISLRYDSSKWHTEEQWLLEALDLESGFVRSFALKDMKIHHEEE